MNKLSKEKRKQLVLVAVVTLAVLGGLWFGLISFQKQNLRSCAERKEAVDRKLKQVKQMIENADKVEAELGEGRAKLAKFEEGMASGDTYSWAVNTIRQFKLSYKIEIPQFGQIDGPKDVSLLAQFPYKQVSLAVGGKAYFQDFGRFITDFENQFPHIRILNLNLEPISSLVSTEREMLSFRMEIAALVKPVAP